MERSDDLPVADTAQAKSDLLQPVLVLFFDTNVENLLKNQQRVEMTETLHRGEIRRG